MSSTLAASSVIDMPVSPTSAYISPSASAYGAVSHTTTLSHKYLTLDKHPKLNSEFPFKPRHLPLFSISVNLGVTVGNLSSFQLLSRFRLFVTLWTAACQASLSISQSFLKLMSIKSVLPSNHLILCCPLLAPSVFPSIRLFSNESVLHVRWPKYWSFSINPSNEYSRLVSFRMDWLDLLAVQGTLKSLLQQHSSKASILWCSAFFTVQLSHPYMTTGKTIALTRQTFVGKEMSLLFNMLSRLVI